MTSTENAGRRPTDARDRAVPQVLPDVTDGMVADLVKLFKLLADPTRLQILLMLADRGEMNVRTLCKRLGQNQPAVSHHLALLRVSGLVEARRAGKHNFYRIHHHRIRELFDDVFSGTPEAERSLRIQDYVLRYHPRQADPPTVHAGHGRLSYHEPPSRR